MVHHIQFEQWVPFPIEQVFLFFADPNNLPRIMPPSTGTKINELRLVPPPGGQKLAGVGSEIVTSFRVFPLLPIRAQWTARIVEFEWNHHFADVQEKGPFKSFHHRHELSAEQRHGINGTAVRDVIDYAVGFGFLGEIPQRIFIARQMKQTFAYRQQALAVILSEAGSFARE